MTGKKISCHMYQKSPDTGIILSFRSCELLEHEKINVEGYTRDLQCNQRLVSF